MSTHAAIIAKTDTGYAGIYCHFDGYAKGVGKMLQTHYLDAEKVAKLIALGDISSLGERVDPIGPHSFSNREPGTTVAYMRDRGETGCKACTGRTVIEVAGQIDHTDSLVYVFEDGAWVVGNQPLPLALRWADQCGE